ncbi:hypothetical protein NQ317_009545 [Molorchus minor]|uniref:Tyr recombinase domain-containing protein n=1 Tax=Molorchus minor TaxID=1323400 RepID=A0ABQ9J805_9CUCU|nr:hypothetical protein NQ317_009545 [Molorchus minor]
MAGSGFVKATSGNLPAVDVLMVAEFMKRDKRFNIAEVRGSKARNMNVSFKSNEDDSIRDPDYESGDYSEETSEDDLVQRTKMQSKFARHLENKHLDKSPVKLFLSLPKKSAERLHIIDKLRKEGDFIYNSDSSYNQGDIILVRRPQIVKNRNAEHYLPCANCNAMYSKLSLNVHYRMCLKDREKFKKDTLCASRMKMKQRPEVKNFESIFDPIYYDDMIRSINNMAGLNEKIGKYKSPSTAACICSYLKKISIYLVTELIKRNDKTKLERVRDFYQLMEDGCTYDIYKTVSENQMEMKRHKTVKLPSSNDINMLRDYLDKYIHHHFKLLNDKFTEDCWMELSGAVLASLQLFNRRRAGEIERIKISDFKEYETANVNDDISQDLQITPNQKYVRFMIRGKKARGVPVLVDKFKLKCLKIILKYRQTANVPSTNPFLFGIPGKDDMQHLSANKLMSHFAHCCGAKNPERLKGTELRKQFATKCSTMDLQGMDIKDVADYMGHHEKIHLEHYRMPNATRDIVRMSRLLEKAQGIDCDSKQNSEQDEKLPSYADIQDKTMELKVTPVKSARISWSKDEKKFVENEANFYLESFESPTMEFCALLVKQPVLKRRSAITLKAYIMNEIKRRKNNALVIPKQKKCKRGVKKFWTEEEKEKSI